MPKPTAEYERLEKLAGIWTGGETLHPSPWDPKGRVARATTRARVALAGFGVVANYEQTSDGQRSFEGHGVYTWDAKAGEVVLHWFDSMGMGVDEFRGVWEGDRLRLERRNAMELWRMSSDRSKPGRVTSRMEASQDGKSWTVMFDGSYARED